MKSNFNLSKILSCVCNYYQIEIQELISNSRKKHLITPRQMYCYIANEYTENTLTLIAENIKRDHSTIVYSINKIRVEKEIYKEIKKDIEAIVISLHTAIIPIDIDLLKLTQNYTNSFIN